MRSAGEIIVVDGCSADDTREAAADAGATVITSARGRGVQLRRGVEAAQREWLLFLHADTVLEPGWTVSACNHLIQRPDRAGYFRLELRSRDWRARLVEQWVGLRCRLFALPFGDQGLLISRRLYDELGGFPPVPLMEDVALVRRLGRDRLTPLDAAARTSAERWERDGWARRSLRNLALLLLYLGGVSPQRLERRYR